MHLLCARATSLLPTKMLLAFRALITADVISKEPVSINVSGWTLCFVNYDLILCIRYIFDHPKQSETRDAHWKPTQWDNMQLAEVFTLLSHALKVQVWPVWFDN